MNPLVRRPISILLVVQLSFGSAISAADRPRSYEVDHPQFQVVFPAGFIAPAEREETLEPLAVKARQLISMRGLDTCGVWWADFTVVDAQIDANTVLRMGLTTLKADPRMHVEKEEKFTRLGYAGTRLDMTTNNDGIEVYLRQEMIADGGRLYQLICGGPEREARNGPEVQQFFKSFVLKQSSTGADQEAVVRLVGQDPNQVAAMTTAERMRSIATAWEAYATDVNAYWAQGELPPTKAREIEGGFAWSDVRNITQGELARTLAPTYIRSIPVTDGWNQPFTFAVVVNTNRSAETYIIRSFGADRRPDREPLYQPGVKPSLEADLLFSGGRFMTWPQAFEEMEEQRLEERRAAVAAEEAAEERLMSKMTPEQQNRVHARNTMADLRRVATATEAFATDNNAYPAAANISELATHLSPTYIRTLPDRDRWETPLRYLVSSDRQTYRIISAGADRKVEARSLDLTDSTARAAANYDGDIIYELGTFVQYPQEYAEMFEAERQNAVKLELPAIDSGQPSTETAGQFVSPSTETSMESVPAEAGSTSSQPLFMPPASITAAKRATEPEPAEPGMADHDTMFAEMRLMGWNATATDVAAAASRFKAAAGRYPTLSELQEIRKGPSTYLGPRSYKYVVSPDGKRFRVIIDGDDEYEESSFDFTNPGKGETPTIKNDIIYDTDRFIQWYSRDATPLSAVRSLADHGDPDSQYELGSRYEDAMGIPADPLQAASWYYKAAMNGHVDAQYAMARMHEQGIGVGVNKKAAFGWFKLAAEAGHSYSQHRMGEMLDAGDGVPEDKAKAATWYTRASENGEHDATYRLAQMYEAGEGVQQNVEKAIELYERLVEFESVFHKDDALMRLGEIYEMGLGVPKNRLKAITYYSRSDRSEAREKLEALTRE